MWLLKALLGFLDGLMSFINRKDIKQDGKNEEKLEALQEVEERWRKANEIENEPVADDDILILLRPEERTADNLRLLQDSKTDVHGQRGASENATPAPHEKREDDAIQPQPKVREVMPVKFPKLPMPVQFLKPRRKVNRVFLHCSASDNPKHDNPETIDAWHLERWPTGIGYHFYINQRGEVFQGRDIELPPVAQKGHNLGTIAICCGGLTIFSQAQLTALYMLCKRINAAFEGDITFHGHCEVAKKECPVYPYKTILKLDPQGKMSVN